MSVPRLAKKVLDLSSFPSSHSPSLSIEIGTNQDSTDSLSLRDSLDQEPEPVVSYINLKPEGGEEKKISPRLKVGFKERHRKCLSEALPTAPLLAKRSRSEAFCEELASDAPIMQVPPSDVVRSRRELVVILSIEDTRPTEDQTSTATPSGNANERDALASPSS